MRYFLTRKKLLLFVGIFSTVIHALFFLFWLKSPLRFFHLIDGLDMATLLKFSEWPGEFSPLFVVHRFLIYLVWIANGGIHNPAVIVCLQSLFSIAGAILLTDIALLMWGKRKPALAAGVFYACYGPVLLYDFCILQESVISFLILLSVRSYFLCRKSAGAGGFAGGMLTALAAAGRPVSALLMLFFPVKIFLEGKRRNAAVMTAGILAMLLIASLFNAKFASSFNPFFNVMPYTLHFHAGKTSPPAVNAAEAPRQKQETSRSRALQSLLCNLPKRAAAFLLTFEMPENLNYYFLKERIPLLKCLPGPQILMPVALAGILLMLLRIRHREGILLMILLLLALPLAARDPIGRYRLLLIPYLILAGVFFFRFPGKNRRSKLLCGAALLLSLALQFFCSPPGFHRASDYVAWGKALEYANGNRISQDSLNEFYAGWQMSNHSDRACAVNLIIRCLKSGNAAGAMQICGEGLRGEAKEKSIYHYYRALILVSSRQFEAAEKELEQIRIREIPQLENKIKILQNAVKKRTL